MTKTRISQQEIDKARRNLRDQSIDKIEDKEQLKQRLDEYDAMSGREVFNLYNQLQLFI